MYTSFVVTMFWSVIKTLLRHLFFFFFFNGMLHLSFFADSELIQLLPELTGPSYTVTCQRHHDQNCVVLCEMYESECNSVSLLTAGETQQPHKAPPLTRPTTLVQDRQLLLYVYFVHLGHCFSEVVLFCCSDCELGRVSKGFPRLPWFMHGWGFSGSSRI